MPRLGNPGPKVTSPTVRVGAVSVQVSLAPLQKPSAAYCMYFSPPANSLIAML